VRGGSYACDQYDGPRQSQLCNTCLHLCVLPCPRLALTPLQQSNDAWCGLNLSAGMLFADRPRATAATSGVAEDVSSAVLSDFTQSCRRHRAWLLHVLHSRAAGSEAAGGGAATAATVARSREEALMFGVRLGFCRLTSVVWSCLWWCSLACSTGADVAAVAWAVAVSVVFCCCMMAIRCCSCVFLRRLRRVVRVPVASLAWAGGFDFDGFARRICNVCVGAAEPASGDATRVGASFSPAVTAAAKLMTCLLRVN
jgi:hypothetical protein